MKALLALGYLVVASSTHANPVDAFGYGARAPAMGGAGTAAAREGASNYYNPAALAVSEDIRVDLGYQLALPSLSMNGADQGVDASRGLTAAVAVPGHIGGLHVAFGVAALLPDERLVRTRTMPSGKPRWMYYDNRPQRFFLSSNVSFRIGKLHFGGGVSYMSRTEGVLDLDGRVGFPIAEDSSLTLDIDVKLKAVRYPQLGVLWQASPWLDLGVTYRGGFVLQIDQRFSITGDLGAEMTPLVTDAFFQLNALALDLFQPEQVAAGFQARIFPGVTVAGDLTYQRWSAFENPAAHIRIAHDLKEFDSLVKIPAALPLEKAYFHDTFVPRVGVEIEATRGRKLAWLVRAGYSYEPSPAPEQRGETNLVDNDKHTLSAGVGLEVAGLGEIVPRPFDIDLFVAGTLLPERGHRKLSPVDSVGDYAARGAVLAAGLATRWRF